MQTLVDPRSMSARRAASNFWTMTQGKIVEGLFAVNKPTGITSAQVIRDLQYHFSPSKLFAPWLENQRKARARESSNQRKRRREKDVQVKIGHGGTLDPLATGVLIVGIGRGTKSLQDFLMCTKTYEAVILFGTDTDTYDRVGKVLRKAPYDHVTREMVEKALEKFRGRFMQLPPLFSALKMNGKPLYEYAREGKEIPREIERRSVDVLDLEMLEWMEGGTHSHFPPTDEAGYAEVNVANKLWKQEESLSADIMTDMNVHSNPARAPQQKDDGDDDSNIHSCQQAVSDDGIIANSNSTVTTKQPSKASLAEEKDLGAQNAETTPKDHGESVIERKQVQEASAAKLEGGDATSSTMEADGMGEKKVSDTPSFESEKRKLSADQDELVSNHPLSKKHQSEAPSKSTTAMMSGGLGDSALSGAPFLRDATHRGPPAARLRMTVTSGFYVRSLCHDLGAAVGSAALMAELQRTRQGDYRLGNNVLEYSHLMQGEAVWGPLIEQLLDEWEVRNPVGLQPRGGIARKDASPRRRGGKGKSRGGTSSPATVGTGKSRDDGPESGDAPAVAGAEEIMSSGDTSARIEPT